MNKYFDFNILTNLKEKAKEKIKQNEKNNNNNYNIMTNYNKGIEKGYVSFVLHTHLPYISHPEDDRIFRRIMAF